MLPETFVLTGFISSVVLLIVTVIYSYFLHKKENKCQHTEMHAYKKSQEILKEAHKQAVEIVEASSVKAKNILSGTETFKDSLEKDLETQAKTLVQKYLEVFEKSSKDLSGSYVELFARLKDESIKESRAAVEKLKSSGDNSVLSFSTFLREEIVKAESEIKIKLTAQFELAKKEIEAYKEGELKKVPGQISQAVAKLSQDVLGHAITVNEHDKLVMEALEKAKKEGVFD